MAKLSGESTAPAICNSEATTSLYCTSRLSAAARQVGMRFGLAFQAVAVCAALFYVESAYAITIEFNYDMDLTGFFGTDEAPTEARTTLEFVARAFAPFSDNLAAIAPAGADSWSAFFPNPGAGFTACACNIAVPEDALVVYVGAHDLPDGQIAQAGPGNWGVDDPMSASSAFRSAVANRGQGSVVDDFAPWGGSLAFDTVMPNGSARVWHFDVDAPPTFPAYDFASTAVHELAHILGFGVSASFRNKANQNAFTGAAASELYGGPVPLSDDDAHWAPGVSSPPYLLDPPQAALGPSLAAGERKLLTPLDYAALSDIGWQVPAQLLTLPGDLDNDADVDGSDLLMWQRQFGLAGTSGDANGDGWVNDYDRWLLEQNFGAVAAQPLESLPTPEPAGAALCLIALGAFAWRLSAKRNTGCRSSIPTSPSPRGGSSAARGGQPAGTTRPSHIRTDLPSPDAKASDPPKGRLIYLVEAAVIVHHNVAACAKDDLNLETAAPTIVHDAATKDPQPTVDGRRAVATARKANGDRVAAAILGIFNR